MSAGVAGLGSRPTCLAVEENVHVSGRLQMDLSRLDIKIGLSMRWKAIGEYWQIHGRSEIVGWWVRITHAFFELPQQTVHAIITNVIEHSLLTVTCELARIMIDAKDNIAESKGTQYMEMHRGSAAADIVDALWPPATRPKDADVRGTLLVIAMQWIRHETESVYNLRGHVLLCEKLRKLWVDCQDIAQNLAETLSEDELNVFRVLGNPDRSLFNKQLKLAKIMTVLFQIIFHGNNCLFQAELTDDVNHAYRPDLFRYDQSSNTFISPCMSEVAAFFTQLKREADNGFRVATQAYVGGLPDRIVDLERRAEDELASNRNRRDIATTV
ncbi:MAG: hypothetical protein LBF26_00085 [Puniceicoccales bacterium]|jgi:hypothetical protein|nr:hypothetical protein [Puniceicoccales bacterium]